MSATQYRGLYRSRNGALFGVCRGFANGNQVSVSVVRAVFVLFFFLTGFWPAVLLYLVGAVLMKPEPVLAPETESDREFYSSFASDRGMALARLKRKFDEIDRRAARLEHIVTARGFDWDRRMGQG